MNLLSFSGGATKNKLYCIYKLISPSGKVYIGQTCNLKKRINKYKQLQCKQQQKIYKAILKYSWESFKIEIIVENLTKENIDSEEIKQIQIHNSVKEGYNISHGGGGILGMERTPETRKKMSESRKGIVYSEETKKRISQGKMGSIPWNKGIKSKLEPSNKLEIPLIALDYKTSELKEVICKSFQKKADILEFKEKGWRYWCNVLYNRVRDEKRRNKNYKTV
jgi:group I intron endonuclease